MPRFPHSIVCILLLALANVGHASDDRYQAGLDQFRQGEYGRALSLFRAHQQSGNHSATLTYNIAACLYKLGQYAQARQQFSKLLDDPRWQHLARYNLGIIEEKLAEPAAALVWYRQVQHSASDEKLQQMAARRVEAIMGTSAHQARSRWAISGGVGYDTNPYGFNDTIKPTNASDQFIDVLVYGDRQISEEFGVTALLFNRQYSDFDNISTGTAEVGAQYQGQRTWLGYPRHGIYATVLTLDGDTYSQEVRGQLGFEYRFEKSILYWRYDAMMVKGGSDYGYLDGHRQRARIEWSRRGSVPRMAVYYQLGIDDHKDLFTDTYSVVQSRTAHQIGLRASWPFFSSWEASTAFVIARKEYDGESRLTDLDGQFKAGERLVDAQLLQLGLVKTLAPAWRASTFIELEHTSDRFDLYSHDRASLKLELTYRNN